MVGTLGAGSIRFFLYIEILFGWTIGLSWIFFFKSPKKIIPKGSIWIGGGSGPSGCNRGLNGGGDEPASLAWGEITPEKTLLF